MSKQPVRNSSKARRKLLPLNDPLARWLIAGANEKAQVKTRCPYCNWVQVKAWRVFQEDLLVDCNCRDQFGLPQKKAYYMRFDEHWEEVVVGGISRILPMFDLKCSGCHLRFRTRAHCDIVCQQCGRIYGMTFPNSVKR